MTGKICISTVVNYRYMAYVPLFVYCMNRAYPLYRVRLFLRNECPYSLKGMDCDIIPLFEDFPDYKYNSIALRFAIDKEYYKGFDYVYITDIDMMIMMEDPDLEYFHRIEMEKSKLCYSNSLRNANHYQGSESLTGLHFASKEWFERTNDVTAEYRKNLKAGLLGLYREYDGVMLYRINQRSGTGLPGKLRLTNRHHGIHCNNFQLFGLNKLKLDTRIPMTFRIRWLQYLANSKFRRLCEQAKNADKKVRENLTMLEDLCRGKV